MRPFTFGWPLAAERRRHSRLAFASVVDCWSMMARRAEALEIGRDATKSKGEKGPELIKLILKPGPYPGSGSRMLQLSRYSTHFHVGTVTTFASRYCSHLDFCSDGSLLLRNSM